ncbi:hypothetical protein M0813_23622 [Anaeramoeba flamelloides]|uniref:Uncharacterized protein n=1 Tax=Anaeramoeba flamelloides TaxID=1746091 RepID=A0ABQ8Y841_9EUKA|nr:hypothetical protein M0813_23622 [Anaeramoeba flamelloides]
MYELQRAKRKENPIPRTLICSISSNDDDYSSDTKHYLPSDPETPDSDHLSSFLSPLYQDGYTGSHFRNSTNRYDCKPKKLKIKNEKSVKKTKIKDQQQKKEKKKQKKKTKKKKKKKKNKQKEIKDQGKENVKNKENVQQKQTDTPNNKTKTKPQKETASCYSTLESEESYQFDFTLVTPIKPLEEERASPNLFQKYNQFNKNDLDEPYFSNKNKIIKKNEKFRRRSINLFEFWEENQEDWKQKQTEKVNALKEKNTKDDQQEIKKRSKLHPNKELKQLLKNSIYIYSSPNDIKTMSDNNFQNKKINKNKNEHTFNTLVRSPRKISQIQQKKIQKPENNIITRLNFLTRDPILKTPARQYIQDLKNNTNYFDNKTNQTGFLSTLTSESELNSETFIQTSDHDFISKNIIYASDDNTKNNINGYNLKKKQLKKNVHLLNQSVNNSVVSKNKNTQEQKKEIRKQNMKKLEFINLEIKK